MIWNANAWATNVLTRMPEYLEDIEGRNGFLEEENENGLEVNGDEIRTVREHSTGNLS